MVNKVYYKAPNRTAPGDMHINMIMYSLSTQQFGSKLIDFINSK